MDYSDYAEELQKRIKSFDQTKAELKKAYEQTLKANSDAYSDTLDMLRSAKHSEQNAAAANSALAKQSADVALTQRGLASSGEAAQSDIEHSLSLGKALSDIDKDYAERELAAEQTKSDADTEAAKELKRGADELQAELDETNTLLDEAQKADAEQKEALSREIAAAEEAVHDGKAVESEEAYKPPVSAKQMASNILSASTASGTVKTELDNAKTYMMLQEMQAEYGFDSDYVKDLTVALKSKGYRQTTKQEAEAQIAADYAESHLSDWAGKVYKQLSRSTASTQDNVESARKAALTMQKQYVYTHCTSIQAVKRAFKLLGFSDEDFVAYRAAAEKDGLELGMDAD